MPGGKCVFNDAWLKQVLYKAWLQKDPKNRHAAYCSVCSKTIDIGNMGESAVKSHMQGVKHKQLIVGGSTRVATVSSFLESHSSASNDTTSAKPLPSTSSTETSQQPSLNVTTADVLKAEILWTLKCVDSHYSYSSCTGVNSLLKAMFPDSKIAAGFNCSEKKASYLCAFGLGPYFAEQLSKSLQSAQSYVLLFDETLNKQMQEKQLDVYLRFWEKENVVTKYFDSRFMGHATAADLFKELRPLVVKFGHQKLLQLSMDGPNVNLALADLLKKDIDVHAPNFKLLEIGTCGLHTLHNAFRSGCSATPWDLETLLSAGYHLLHDSPARREDFFRVSGATQAPLKYCRHRWLENKGPAERLLNLLPSFEAYCSAVKSKKFSEPTCKSFRDLLQHLGDPLIKSKLEFFISVAKSVEPFLTLYQTDRPMIPFLADDLKELITDLMKRIVTDDVMDANKETLYLLDIKNKAILKDPSKVDVGFLARQSMLTKKASDKGRYTFRMECRDFIQAMLLKILLKAPIKQILVRCLSWLNPKKMAATERPAVIERGELLEQTLQIMVEAGRVRKESCDTIIQQYSKFCDSLLVSGNREFFKEFSHKIEDQRVDVLLQKHMNKHTELWNVAQQLLLLSHGQASVERGFSVHKQTTEENLTKESLKARRLIVQAVREAGDAGQIVVNKEMLSYASAARSNYQTHTENKRQQEVSRQASQKRKAEEEELACLKKKRLRLMADAECLENSADQKAKDAQAQRKLDLIVESNTLRDKAKELKRDAEKLDRLISKKESDGRLSDKGGPSANQ